MALTAVLTTWSLLAVGLAQLGLFRWWSVLLISLIASATGWVYWRTRSPSARFEQRETLFLVLLLVVGLILFAFPAEHLLQMGDSSIYPNTASKLIDTGGLSYHYDPLDGLSPEQKELFYVPSSEQLSDIDIQAYEGLLYGAYYVMEPAQNTIVASRPPLAIVWMGLFGLLGGSRGILYVTPLFGVVSLLVVYFLGRRLFNTRAGALAALWLLLSFPQLHFSRAPYAEVVGQFFVLTALYALVIYLQTRRLRYVPLGVAALTAGFSARLDVLLFLPVLFVFILLLILRRDRRGLVACVVSVVVALGFTAWTVNRPYVGATGELLLRGQLRFLRLADPCFLVGAGLAGLMVVAGLIALLQSLSPLWRRRLVRWGVLLVVVVGVGYNLYIRPNRPEYVTVGEERMATHHEEVMAVAAEYVSHPFLWLAAFGMVCLFWQRRIDDDRLLFAFFAAFFAAGFFWKYTTARVYPVALRRLVPEVLPGCALLAAFAVRQLAQQGRHWRCVAATLAGLITVLLVSLSGPYWFHRGAMGAKAVLDEMAKQLPADGVMLFEPRQDGSVVGWFAAPLWSFYDRDALLLNNGDFDAGALQGALCYWRNQGRPVYLVAQQDLASWWPDDSRTHHVDDISWKSSIIGQSLRFPPYIWRFVFTFSIYQWEYTTCPSGMPTGTGDASIVAAPS